ncbi:MAG TPA: phage tail protein [Pyrinomonadaceae bacterium]|nr:phage tail protein [Pyrinomonadaceae bacterium]
MIGDNLPVGTVLIWAGDANEIPRNWKVCNGKQLMKTAHSDLYEILGTRWNNDRGLHNDFFCLPDLRGVFLRGVNDDRNDGYHDPNVADRVRLAGQMETSMDDAGSYQIGSVERHTHFLSISQNNGVSGGSPGPDGNNDTGYHLTDLRTSEYGNDETRPVNAYVYFIIKIKN